jgi:hypothetical protein
MSFSLATFSNRTIELVRILRNRFRRQPRAPAFGRAGIDYQPKPEQALALNREARRRGNALAGSDGNTLVRPEVALGQFGAMHRRGVGRSTQSDQ